MVRHCAIFLCLTPWLISCDLLSKDPQNNPNASTFSQPTGPSGTMTQDQARMMLSPNGYGIESIDSLDDMLSGSAASTSIPSTAPSTIARQAVSSSCDPEKSGNLADNDNDKIPVAATYKFNCSTSSSPGTLQISGSGSLTDQNDSVPIPKAGFSSTWDNFMMTTSQFSIVMNGTQSIHIEGNSAQLNRALTATSAGQGKSAYVGNWFDSTATLDDPNLPKKSGRLSIHGFYEVKGEGMDFVVEIDGDVSYGNCNDFSFFNTGTITFVDGAGNVLAFHYANCTRTATYNGSPIR